MGSTRPLLLIGGASVPAGEECVRQAVKRGLDVWLADSAANLERFPHIVELVEKAITLDYNDVEACVGRLTASRSSPAAPRGQAAGARSAGPRDR